MELKASGIYIKVYHYVAVEKYAKDSKQLEQSVAPDSFAMLAWWLAVIFWGSMFYLIQLAWFLIQLTLYNTSIHQDQSINPYRLVIWLIYD